MLGIKVFLHEFSTFRGIPYRNIESVNKVEMSHFDYPFDDDKKVELLKTTFRNLSVENLNLGLWMQCGKH